MGFLRGPFVLFELLTTFVCYLGKLKKHFKNNCTGKNQVASACYGLQILLIYLKNPETYEMMCPCPENAYVTLTLGTVLHPTLLHEAGIPWKVDV